MLFMSVAVERKTWDEILPYVTFAMNTAFQKTTGLAPFQMVYGRTVTTTLDLLLPVHEVGYNGDNNDFAHKEEGARQLARQQIENRERVDASRYSQHRTTIVYSAGGAVWVRMLVGQRGRSGRLLRYYFRPIK